jgi:hypothetical protein
MRLTFLPANARSLPMTHVAFFVRVRLVVRYVLDARSDACSIPFLLT